MTSSPVVQDQIRKYLLGQLTAEDREEIERRLLIDDELFEEVLIMEDDLVDEYLDSELSAAERQLFEQNFLADSESRQKLRLGRALDRHLSAKPLRVVSKSGARDESRPWTATLFSAPLRIAACVVIILGVAFGAWLVFFHQSDVDKGLIALNAAYREQRPVQSRVSAFDYAPFSETRGGAPARVDTAARDRAERILLDAVHDNPGASSYHALGQLYLAEKQFDKAIEQLDKAVKADPRNPKVLSDLGAALIEKGKIDQASSAQGQALEEFARSLENLNQALQLNSNLLEALFNRALCHQYLPLPQAAENDWREYLKKDSSSRWADEARENLKRIEEQTQKTSLTKEGLRQDFLDAYEARNVAAAWGALSLSRTRAGDSIVEGLLDDYLSLAGQQREKEASAQLETLAYAGLVELQRAGDHYTADLVAFYQSATRTQREAAGLAREVMKSANDRYDKGELQQALKLFSQASPLFVDAGDQCEALLADTWVGYCYLRIPDVAKVLETFKRVSGFYENKQYRSLLAESLMAFSDAEANRNEVSRSIDYAYRSLKLSEEIQDTSNILRCLEQLTSRDLQIGDYNASLSASERAFALERAIPHEPKVLWHFYHETALDFYWLGLTTTALEFENAALHEATEAKWALIESRSYERLGLIQEKLRHPEEAIEDAQLALEQAKNIADELPRTNVVAHASLNLGRLHRESGDPQRAIGFYNQSIDLYQKLNNLQFYLYEAHKGKLLTLIALNDDAAAETELGVVLPLFEQYRPKIAEESNRNKFFDTGQNTYDLAIDFEYSRMKNTEKAFAHAEACRARSLLDLMATSSRVDDQGLFDLRVKALTESLSISEIQKRMPEQVQILEYAVLDNKVIAWVVTKQNINHAESRIAASELDRIVRECVLELHNGSTNDESTPTNALKRLYAILIDPAKPFLDSRLQLCIIPDKVLNDVPFGALLSSSGKYLVEDYALEQAPSATVFITCSELAKAREGSQAERILSVGNPRFDRTTYSDLEDLPDARREAEAVASYYALRTVLVEEAAIGKRVKQALSENEVIHFATHLVSNEQSPMLSKLLLTKTKAGTALPESQGALSALEIYRMKLPRAHLVVLSACQSGVERWYKGEGAIGLARPFVAASVPLVVASLWPIDSETSADLMVSFHKHRRQDRLTTVEALRRAQLDTIRNQQPNSKKNYGWAAFTVIGGYTTF